ncbi:MAG: AMP-binding protein [Actinobacteria bacterium]|nr:AMP-binding protein [Actinomycetota bacterium]
MDTGYLTRQALWDIRRTSPDTAAISLEQDVGWTYADLYDKANSYSNTFLAYGVEPGDRVAILLYNCLEYWAVYLGVMQIGAIAVRLNFRLAAEELEYAICDSDSKVLCGHCSLLHRLEGIRHGLPVNAYFALHDADEHHDSDEREECPQWATPWAVLEGGDSRSPEVTLPRSDDGAMLMYTSGTTGRPKGALWTHGNTAWFAAMQVMQWQFTADTTSMVTGPMYHVGALEDIALPTVAVGGHVVILKSTGFDIRWVLELIDDHGVTDVVLFPFMIYSMLQLAELAEFSLSSLKRIYSGGDPVLPWAVERLHALYPHLEFTQVYGLTEGTPVATCSTSQESWAYPEAVGRPMPFTEISLHDDAGQIVPPGQAGEIWIRSPVVSSQYWRRPEDSASTFTDGWCHTGDLGVQGESGLLMVVGRKKDMIRTGGENVYPAEVEDVLARHPLVREAAVIGLPDPEYIEVVCAVIVPDAPGVVDAGTIVEYVREHLAGYKRPRKVFFTESLPRTPSGKVMKYELRDRYASLDTMATDSLDTVTTVQAKKLGSETNVSGTD